MVCFFSFFLFRFILHSALDLLVYNKGFFSLSFKFVLSGLMLGEATDELIKYLAIQ